MADTKDLQSQLLDWLSKEGYPLEFKVANQFRRSRFATYQGRYVKDIKSGNPREIDVVAQLDTAWQSQGPFIRVKYIVECKWTGNKPWVIFTDPSSRISEGACIAQTIATKAADAMLWILAKHPDIQELSIFHTPDRPGFNGRQAFGSQNDLVYSSLQSVMSACLSEKHNYEWHHQKPADSLDLAIVLLPLIVIDGKLFEAFYNDEKEEVQTEERPMIRLHWRGAEAWNMHSTVDIVTVNHLPDYLAQRRPEIWTLIEQMQSLFPKIRQCIESNSLAPLEPVMHLCRN